MQANSPSAFLLSATLHGLVVALIFLVTYLLHQQVKESPKIFELVAGAGNNYAATEAPPAIADPINFDLPETPAPVIRPDPVPEIIPEIVPEKVVTPDPVPVLSPPKTVIPKPKPKPTPKAPSQKVEPPPKKMSLAEFQKLHGKAKNASVKPPAAPRPIKTRKIDANSFANVSSKTMTGAGGKALSREEGNLLESYQALLLQRLSAAHQKPSGLSDLLTAEVRFSIAADGGLSSVKIVRSSGSVEFDESVLRAFKKVRTIGRTPTGKSYVWTVTFRMRDAG